MVLLGPRPFILSVVRLPLVSPNQPWVKQIPIGAPWKFRFLLVKYAPQVDGGDPTIQVSHDLRFVLYDAKGEAYQIAPTPFRMVTTPGDGVSLAATHPYNVAYPGGSVIRLMITGWQSGLGPDAISITLVGTRGWETMGGGA